MCLTCLNNICDPSGHLRSFMGQGRAKREQKESNCLHAPRQLIFVLAQFYSTMILSRLCKFCVNIGLSLPRWWRSGTVCPEEQTLPGLQLHQASPPKESCSVWISELWVPWVPFCCGSKESPVKYP